MEALGSNVQNLDLDLKLFSLQGMHWSILHYAVQLYMTFYQVCSISQQSVYSVAIQSSNINSRSGFKGSLNTAD